MRTGSDLSAHAEPAEEKRANMGEFFATEMGVIEREGEFVRLAFTSDRQVVTIVLTPSAFAAMAWLVAFCPDGILH